MYVIKYHNNFIIKIIICNITIQFNLIDFIFLLSYKQFYNIHNIYLL